MMNDMMPTIEETATPDILAQIEHEEGVMNSVSVEVVEALHGPLLTKTEWDATADMASSDERCRFENAQVRRGRRSRRLVSDGPCK